MGAQGKHGAKNVGRKAVSALLAFLLTLSVCSLAVVLPHAEAFRFEMDLGEEKAVSGVAFRPSEGSYMPESVRFYASTDGIEYYDINAGGETSVRNGVFTSALSGRGTILVRYLRAEGESESGAQVSGRIEITEGDPEDAVAPAGPFPCEGLNEDGYGVVCWTAEDVPGGFHVNDDESFTSNGQPLNLALSQITICEKVEKNVYRILWNDCNGWNAAERKAMHVNFPEEVEGILYEDDKVYLQDGQIALLTSSSGQFVTQGDGVNSTAKWMLRGMPAGSFVSVEEDGVRLLLTYIPENPPEPEPEPDPEPDLPDDPYERAILEGLGEKPKQPYFKTSMDVSVFGEEAELKITVNNFLPDDVVSGLYLFLSYDTEKLEFVPDYNTEGALDCVEGLPADTWENLSTDNTETPGVLALQFVEPQSEENCLTEEDELLLTLHFRLKEDAEEGGVWIPHAKAQCENWQLENHYGEGSYCIIVRDRSYATELAKRTGDKLEDPMFSVDVTAEQDGETMTFTFRPVGFTAEDGILSMHIPVRYDPERMELLTETNGENALQCVSPLTEGWENLCVLEKEGLVYLQLMNAEKPKNVLKPEDELTFTLQFAWKDGATDAGVWIVNGEPYAENWDMDQFKCNGGYAALRRFWTYEMEIASRVGKTADPTFVTDIQYERTEEGLKVTVTADGFPEEPELYLLHLDFHYDPERLQNITPTFEDGTPDCVVSVPESTWSNLCEESTEKPGLLSLTVADRASRPTALGSGGEVVFVLYFAFLDGETEGGVYITSDSSYAENIHHTQYTGQGSYLVMYTDFEAEMNARIGEPDPHPAFRTDVAVTSAGADVIVDVLVSGFTASKPVYGFALDLHYDPEALSFISNADEKGVRYILSGVPSADWVNRSSGDNGVVTLKVENIGEDPTPASSDTEFLFRLRFKRLENEPTDDVFRTIVWIPHDSAVAFINPPDEAEKTAPGEGGWALFEDRYALEIAEKAGEQSEDLPFEVTLEPGTEEGSVLLRLHDFSEEEAFTSFTILLNYDAEKLALATQPNERGILECVSGLPGAKWENWCVPGTEEGTVDLLIMNLGDMASLATAGCEIEFRLDFAFLDGCTEGGVWIPENGIQADNWDFVTSDAGGYATVLRTSRDFCPPQEYTYMNADARYLASKADCTHAATYFYSCPWCGEAGEETFVYGEPLGHTGGTATCCAKAVCERCGEEYGELDLDHHTFESVYTKPTTKTNGFTTYTCVDCGYSYVEYDDPDTTIKLLMGDIDMNGIINSKDYAMLKRYVLKTLSLTDEQVAVADLNGDGKVNSLDYLILKRIVLGTYQP